MTFSCGRYSRLGTNVRLIDELSTGQGSVSIAAELVSLGRLHQQITFTVRSGMYIRWQISGGHSVS